MSTAFSSADAHFQRCTRGRDCRCPAYVVDASSESSGQSFGHAPGMHFTQAQPNSVDTAAPCNLSTYTGQYQAYTGPNVPPHLWTSQVNVLSNAPDASVTQVQVLPAAVASYNYPAPSMVAPAYSAYPPSFSNSQWEVTGAPSSQGAHIAPAIAVVNPTVENTRIDIVPGEERVYEIVTRVRF